MPNKLFPLCLSDFPVIGKWCSALFHILSVEFTLPPAETLTQHLPSIIPDPILSSSWQNKGLPQHLPHRLLHSLKNCWPIGDRWIQNHLCPYYGTDCVPKLCADLWRLYGLACCTNYVDHPLAFGVFVSSTLTLFSFILVARGSSLRFRTRAFIAFKFFLCCVWPRSLLLHVGPSCMDHTRIWQLITQSLKMYNKCSLVSPYPN